MSLHLGSSAPLRSQLAQDVMLLCLWLLVLSSALRAGSTMGSDDSGDDDTVSTVASEVQLTSLANAQLVRTPILDLRPTQLVVGYQQVGEKAAKIVKKDLINRPKKLEKFLRKRPIPVVIGPPPPNDKTPDAQPVMYLIDHHHLACALLQQNIPFCYTQIAMDWSEKPWDEFWKAMHEKGLVWTHNAAGEEVDLPTFVGSLPRDVRQLCDDPMRSLAALVRSRGGYDKVWVPFSEFRWANWFRTRVQLAPGTAPDDPAVLSHAMNLAVSADAAHLPGYKQNGQQAG